MGGQPVFDVQLGSSGVLRSALGDLPLNSIRLNQEEEEAFRLSWLGHHFNLTHRELLVFHHLLNALSSKQIAFEMRISRATVDVHRAHIRQKLGVHNTSGAIQIFLRAPPR